MAKFTAVNCKLSFDSWTPEALYIQRSLHRGVWYYELILQGMVLCPEVGTMGKLRIELENQVIERQAYIEAKASTEDGQTILHIGEVV